MYICSCANPNIMHSRYLLQRIKCTTCISNNVLPPFSYHQSPSSLSLAPTTRRTPFFPLSNFYFAIHTVLEKWNKKISPPKLLSWRLNRHSHRCCVRYTYPMSITPRGCPPSQTTEKSIKITKYTFFPTIEKLLLLPEKLQWRIVQI